VDQLLDDEVGAGNFSKCMTYFAPLFSYNLFGKTVNTIFLMAY